MSDDLLFRDFLASALVSTGFSRDPGAPPLVGLSSDLYFPPLEDLILSLSPATPPEYLEIFRGRTEDLIRARNAVPTTIPFSYHGDCLWYTQSDFLFNPAFREETLRANRHMDAIGSPWMIHECAQKTMEGYAFGLYAPPLLTPEGALVARQGALALASSLNGRILLVETPPFPPHPTGPLDLATFFRIVTHDSHLGIGLDIGHCLTYLAVTGKGPDPQSLVAWLREFPLERVVEIHVGGLTATLLEGEECLIDDHSREVPDLLFDSLEAVGRSLSLPNLKGVALEVDNKSLPVIAREFPRFRKIVLSSFLENPITGSRSPVFPAPQLPGNIRLGPEGSDVCLSARKGYETLAQGLMEKGLSPYATTLYPLEVWNFGGSMPDMFPETLSLLEKEGIAAQDTFVDFFNRHPRSETTPFDYLKIKVRRTLEWVDTLSEHLPDPDTYLTIRAMAEKEAGLLILAQEQFNGDPL